MCNSSYSSATPHPEIGTPDLTNFIRRSIPKMHMSAFGRLLPPNDIGCYAVNL